MNNFEVILHYIGEKEERKKCSSLVEASVITTEYQDKLRAQKRDIRIETLLFVTAMFIVKENW